MKLTKQQLHKKYIIDQKSTPQIAREIGCSAVNVNYWLKKYGIPIRDKFDSICRKQMSLNCIKLRTKFEISKKLIEREFIHNRKTINQIASEIGCSWDAVRHKIVRYGFKLNPSMGDGGKRTTTDCRTFQKRILREYGYRCQICGYDKFVNCHHIEKWSKNKNDSVENGIVLCPNHHAEADYGIITPQELQAFKRKSDTPSNGR